MPSITFDLETVTPLFLAGADQTTAELRPPAFRGALRYWFRAIAAGITTFDEVKRWENKVFGSTEAGGAVVIRIQVKQLSSTKSMKQEKDLPGLAYLFFSMFKSNSRDARGCFPPGSSIRIILQTRLPSDEHLKCLEMATGAMWMLINMGGIGSRSNRGAGGLQVKAVSTKGIDLNPLDFNSHVQDINSLAARLSEGIQAVKSLYQNAIKGNPSTLQALAEFDILTSNSAELFVWQPDRVEDIEEWDYILDNLGVKYQEFRRRYKNATQDDYPQIKEWIKSAGASNVTTVKRAAFGLPIQFYFTSLRKPNNKASLEATQQIGRSSSPLHFKVFPLTNRNFAIVILHFRTKLLPDNCKLLLKSRSVQIPVRPEPPDQAIINEFIQSLNNPLSIPL